MAKGGENTKKVAGNAKKAAAKADKDAAEAAKHAVAEDSEWGKGAKGAGKKEAEAAKKADAARKKAERDALLAEEEATARAKPKVNPKAAGKKASAAVSKPLDLGQLDAGDDTTKAPGTLNATGIDDALDALNLAGGPAAGGGDKVERHPERRVKAAYAAFEARRMPELEKENPGLRRQQRVDLLRKEFEKSEENPFNAVHIGYDATRDDVREARKSEREKTEKRLGDKN